MGFTYIQTSRVDADIFLDDEPVASIRELKLSGVRCRRSGEFLIPENVPVPLYWRQYMNHHDPERSANMHGALEFFPSRGGALSFRCVGETASREVRSEYTVTIEADEAGNIEYRGTSSLRVLPGKSWLVTPNPDHGELEFLNVMPADVFVSEPSRRKKFTACLARLRDSTIAIPHHHLESEDKRNIPLGKGDVFLWGIEDDNPAVEILSDTETSTGLCAYMWDAHFALRVCTDGEPVRVSSGESWSVDWKLISISRPVVQVIAGNAAPALSNLSTFPVYQAAVNTFREVPVGLGDEALASLWPWSAELVRGAPDDVRTLLDTAVGFDDTRSLAIHHSSDAQSRWIASTLGPAFGEPPFEDGKRYRLSGYIKLKDARGRVGLLLRYHSEDMGSVFDISTYTTAGRMIPAHAGADWTRYEFVTDRLPAAPDRMHIILEFTGEGTVWFDNVLFERDV